MRVFRSITLAAVAVASTVPSGAPAQKPCEYAYTLKIASLSR